MLCIIINMGNLLYSDQPSVNSSNQETSNQPSLTIREEPSIITGKLPKPLPKSNELFIDELKRVLQDREEKKKQPKQDNLIIIERQDESKRFHDMLINLQNDIREERLELDVQKELLKQERRQFELEKKQCCNSIDTDTIKIIDPMITYFDKYTNNAELLSFIINSSIEHKQLQYTCCIHFTDEYTTLIEKLKTFMSVCDVLEVCTSNDMKDIFNHKNRLLVCVITRELDKNDISHIDMYRKQIKSVSDTFLNIIFVTNNPLYLIDITTNDNNSKENNSFIRHIEFISNE